METRNREVINLGDGFLIIEDNRELGFIENLIERGVLWEFLSALVKDYLTNHSNSSSDNAIKEINKAFGDLADFKANSKVQLESIERVQSEVALLTDMIKKLSDKVDNGVSVQPQGRQSNSAEPNIVIEPEMKVVKAKPPKKGLGGGLGKAAAKMNSLNRK